LTSLLSADPFRQIYYVYGSVSWPKLEALGFFYVISPPVSPLFTLFVPKYRSAIRSRLLLFGGDKWAHDANFMESADKAMYYNFYYRLLPLVLTMGGKISSRGYI
jgi:hypothetical protein